MIDKMLDEKKTVEILPDEKTRDEDQHTKKKEK